MNIDKFIADWKRTQMKLAVSAEESELLWEQWETAVGEKKDRLENRLIELSRTRALINKSLCERIEAMSEEPDEGEEWKSH